MNSLLNPWIFSKILKSYISDIDRIRRYDRKKLERYRDKVFLGVLKRAMRVPLYRKKYMDVDIKSIRGIKDIENLPIITKDDLRNGFPDDLIPEGSNRNKLYMVSTSGSTGKPVTIFTEPYTMFKTLIGFVRILREHNISWRKTRMSIIADLSAESAEEAYFTGAAIPSLKPFFSLDNMKMFHVGDDPERILKEMERFNPELIGGYPGTLKILAILKNRGKGQNIKPKYIGTSGAILDDYTRKYIEDAFDTKVFDVYGATECSPIAFECKKGRYHLQSDLCHLEFLDEGDSTLETEKATSILVTRLFGGGTPIIRYSGISDLLVPSDEDCDCGIITPTIKKIEGRKVDAIILPDGRMIPPSSLTGIPYKIMHRYRRNKIEQFQIIQHDYDKIEILLVINKEIKQPKTEELFNSMRKEYQGIMGNNVDINIKEVDKITYKREGTATPPPVVISKIKKE